MWNDKEVLFISIINNNTTLSYAYLHDGSEAKRILHTNCILFIFFLIIDVLTYVTSVIHFMITIILPTSIQDFCN